MNNYRVAKLINNEFVIDDIRIFYPNVSFPTEGLTKEIIDSFETYEVVERLPCLNIEKIINIPATLKEDRKVYTVEVVPKTKEEIDQEKFIEVRQTRVVLLDVSDIYVVSDRWDTYTDAKKEEWRTYRQTLRDLPQIYANNIHSVVYPQMPT
tara:strand:+ start:5161 stop:5616 length:456 start_codon:yes stop_codon:yes gene_type:complete